MENMLHFTFGFRAIFLFIGVVSPAIAQQPSSQEPAGPATAKTQLIVPRSDVQRASFPVVDVHTHFFVKGKHNSDLLRDYVAMMDRNHIAVCVSLDGTLLKRLDAHCNFLWSEYRDRFVVFANLDFQGDGKTDQRALGFLA